MFLKKLSSQQFIKKQRGSSLAIAVFIIVVMAMLASAISKAISASSEQSVYEVLGTRALFAAEAANERALALIFPLSGAALACAPTSEQIYFTVSGLSQCTARYTCTESDPDAIGVSYYSVAATGVCKNGLAGNSGSPNVNDLICSANQVCVSRTVEVEAKAQ